MRHGPDAFLDEAPRALTTRPRRPGGCPDVHRLARRPQAPLGSVRRRYRAGRIVKLARTTSEYNRPEYRAPGYPGLNYLTLAFLAGVIVLMAFDYPVGSWTLIVSLLFVPLLVVGWVVNRRRIMAAVDARQARKAASSQATPPEGDNPEGAPPERTPPEAAPGG